MTILAPIRPFPAVASSLEADAVGGTHHPATRTSLPAGAGTCAACGAGHPAHLTGGCEAELVAALRAGCPEAAELLVGAVTTRVLAARPSPDDLTGRCWLLLAEWPATRQDIVTAVARRLSRELDEESSRSARLVALPTLLAHPDTPDDPDPDPAPASALVGRAVRLGLVSTGQARLLARIHLDGMTSEEVGALEGRSPEAVRACCHRAVRRLRAARDVLVDAESPGPRTASHRPGAATVLRAA